jgi:hypothetical protein
MARSRKPSRISKGNQEALAKFEAGKPTGDSRPASKTVRGKSKTLISSIRESNARAKRKRIDMILESGHDTTPDERN